MILKITKVSTYFLIFPWCFLSFLFLLHGSGAMSHNIISPFGGESTAYELVDRSNEPQKHGIRIGVERAQTDDGWKGGSPVPMARGAVSEWGIGWKTPAMMIVLYSLGNILC